MCCFSAPVREVSNTRIFARFSGRGTQFLVYSMNYAADSGLAMILPLPVATPASDGSLRFISLKEYATFFDEMERGFPLAPSRSAAGAPSGGYPGGGMPLVVHAVGDFIASFVPTLDDFARLDRRFKLPRRTWDQIPAYRDYGFAVFKLRAKPASTAVHPMAFEFATRLCDTLFLPTVHIHDGAVHPSERFDHMLYLQDYRLRPTYTYYGNPREQQRRTVLGQIPLSASDGVAKSFLDIARTHGIVSPNEICLKRRLRGILPNQDTFIRCG